MNNIVNFLILVTAVTLRGAVALAVSSSPAGEAPGQGGKSGGRGQPAGDPTFFRTEIPASRGNVILGRPTGNAITLSVLLREAARITVAYGVPGNALDRRTATFDLKAGEPREIAISGLAVNAAYEYRVLTAADEVLLPEKGNGAFHTGRPPGAPFVFTIQADSHLDGNCDPTLYAATLANARADKPDFHIDLGDTFMTEKHASRDTAFRQYLAQRYYFGQLCQSAPLFLVLGNHDGENPRGRDGTAGDSLAAWANTTRKRYFPNPVPDGFYIGNATERADAGLLQDYYGWTWGDALFVVLDPYGFKQPQRGRNDNWKRTLGPEQYQWLKGTLEKSRATFKFVFIHQLVGGVDSQARGGVETAPFFEWGGKNLDGSDGFAQNRPDWQAPIHNLLVQNHVSIVFHGHDHLYAREELDGVVYQEVPQPGAPNADARSAAEYGYKSGTILGGAGYLRVAVSAKQATVEYVRTDGTVAHAYTVTAGHGTFALPR